MAQGESDARGGITADAVGSSSGASDGPSWAGGHDVMASTRLPVEWTSPGAARRFVHEVLDELITAADVEAVVLMTSEVVTNALVHTGTPVDLVVRGVGACVQVEASDYGEQLPVLRARTLASESGRGMTIVAALSVDWGVIPTATGKTVWFRRQPHLLPHTPRQCGDAWARRQ